MTYADVHVYFKVARQKKKEPLFRDTRWVDVGCIATTAKFMSLSRPTPSLLKTANRCRILARYRGRRLRFYARAQGRLIDYMHHELAFTKCKRVSVVLWRCRHNVWRGLTAVQQRAVDFFYCCSCKMKHHFANNTPSALFRTAK